MLLYISEAAEQPLFFARPQGEADRALGPHAHVGEDARRLHDHRRARAVIGGAVARHPAIEMRARPHIAGLGVAARNLGAAVVRLTVRIVVMAHALPLAVRRTPPLGEP